MSNTAGSAGIYSFSQADVMTTYSVVISTADSALYTKAPTAAHLPTGWVSIGENYGTNNRYGTGNESGISNSAIVVQTSYSNVSGVNFGIEELPIAGKGNNFAINPGGVINVTVPANTFSKSLAGSDPSPGSITSLRIISFPVNITTMTINGTIYSPLNFPGGGVTIPASATGQPTQTIQIDPYDNFVRVPIIYYAIDNAGNESLLTGLAIMRLITDNDRDGIGEENDIDDDNDGITDYVEVCGNGATSFGCLVGGSDPSGDNDDDGIINFRDADFGTLNAAGCLASIDKDGDGIPDYLDLDSDNDGIPDVVEAYGVDVNGDGLLDNYSDTDGDGLSQNVDGNNTGAAGSGYGLGFIDFDSDGIPNSIDLDSDNDGIPDIIESGSADTDNSGTIDGLVDLNANGMNDASELAGAVLKTGGDANNDGRADGYPNGNADKAGKPNPYDLDSDDDGIVDAIEAGFPFYVTITNGRVVGAAINGWAIVIQSLASLDLANSDNRGKANYLDIDSDDDGITDNIEGQSTLSYVVPMDTDTDGDGLNNNYDITPNAFGGNGITPYDHDFDGLPDYIDLDTDNDGALDINEGSHIFNINYANILTTDADGDGLLDQYDILDLNTLTVGSRYRNIANSQMGGGGSWDGPIPSGSNVQLVRSINTGDRDWRAQSVLPLKVLNLSGKMEQKVSNLKWHVEGEETTAYYTVERSTNGITFSYVATISSNRLNIAEYSYSDDVKNILSSKVYYRIVQMDVNGDKVYSNVVMFKTEEVPSMVLKAYPNPVQDKLTLSIYSPVQDDIHVLILDVNGRTVKEKVFHLEKGDNSFQFTDLQSLSKGVYMIKAMVKDVYLIRFVKD